MVEYEYQVKGTAQTYYSTRENIMDEKNYCFQCAIEAGTADSVELTPTYDEDYCDNCGDLGDTFHVRSVKLVIRL